jgi:hypothetical protein
MVLDRTHYRKTERLQEIVNGHLMRYGDPPLSIGALRSLLLFISSDLEAGMLVEQITSELQGFYPQNHQREAG